MARLIEQFYVLILALVFSITAYAQSIDESPKPFQMGEVRTIHSEVLGRSYDLFVKLPPGYQAATNSSQRYPVIYLNDGYYCWVTAVGVVQAAFHMGGYEKAILVGLSYAKGEGGMSSRTRDMTPTKDNNWKQETGGARGYLTLFKEEIIPFIEQAYRADSNRRILAGQSFGGLFGAYALIEEPGLFQDYILTSPSLWFDNEAMFDLEEKAAKAGRILSGRVYFATGETETPANGVARNNMVGQQEAFAKRLRSRGYENLEVRDEIMEGGTHLSTFPIGLTRALRWLLPGSKIYAG